MVQFAWNFFGRQRVKCKLSSGFWLMLNQNTCAMANHIWEEILAEADVTTFQVMCA